MKGTNKSYWDAAEFTNSKAFDANIVIIMLGTNDSKDAYWNETKFKEDAVALYNTYANLESVERIIFATFPHCYVMSGTDITAAGVDRMVAVQRVLIAENNWESVDMYALTADREDYFNKDKVHFTDEGYAYVAKCMYEALDLEDGNSGDATTSVTLEDVIKNAEFAKVYEDEAQIFDGNRVDDVSEYADEVHSVTHGSVIFRFKVDSGCANQGVMLGAKVSGINPTTNLTSGGDCTSLYINNQNYFRFAFKHTVAALNGTHSFTDEKWHCVVLSSSENGKAMRLTIDGVERWNNTADVNCGLFGKQSALNELTIGAHLDASGNIVNAFKGSISHVVVTSQEISDQEAIDISLAGYSGGETTIGNISRMFNNSIDQGNNTWVFVGGEAVQGTYEQIGGPRNYIGHFEEYIRNQKSAGDDPTRQRYMINTAKAGQTLEDVVEKWDAKVTKYAPRAVAYLVGVEDYSRGTAHIGEFKESLRAFIDKALAEKANSADGTSNVANDQLFLGNWLHPGINGQIVMAKQVMKGMGIWSEDGHIPNLYYKTPLAEETSDVTPTLVTAENLIAVESKILKSESGMNAGSITIKATAGNKTYTSTTKAGKEYAVLNGIPNGTYEVVISTYLTNTAKEVTFAAQTVTIEEGQALEFAVSLSNAKAVDLSVGDTVGELSVSSTAPAGEYTYTL